ncbi:unnamed protein product [Heterosigma akashiwo]
MAIHIRSLAGKTLSFGYDSTMTVWELKLQVYQQEGQPPEHQGFIHDSRSLNDGTQTLGGLGIGEADTIHLMCIAGVSGGGGMCIHGERTRMGIGNECCPWDSRQVPDL